jgi:RNA polymerase sigma-70 factor (ECF subfamily)
LKLAESNWINKARSGDREAFTQLVDQYAKPVFNLCYRMLGNSQDAEDAAQETFLRAYRNLHRYDPQRKFATWLLSVAANYCIDQYRRPRSILVSIEDTEVREPRLGPERRAVVRETRDEVQVMLNKLAPKDRAALILYYWYDYSYSEIAGELKMTESALKARLHRARQSLGRLWLNKHGKPAFGRREAYEEAVG